MFNTPLQFLGCFFIAIGIVKLVQALIRYRKNKED